MPHGLARRRGAAKPVMTDQRIGQMRASVPERGRSKRGKIDIGRLRHAPSRVMRRPQAPDNGAYPTRAMHSSRYPRRPRATCAQPDVLCLKFTILAAVQLHHGKVQLAQSLIFNLAHALSR